MYYWLTRNRRVVCIINTFCIKWSYLQFEHTSFGYADVLLSQIEILNFSYANKKKHTSRSRAKTDWWCNSWLCHPIWNVVDGNASAEAIQLLNTPNMTLTLSNSRILVIWPHKIIFAKHHRLVSSNIWGGFFSLVAEHFILV